MLTGLVMGVFKPCGFNRPTVTQVSKYFIIREKKKTLHQLKTVLFWFVVLKYLQKEKNVGPRCGLYVLSKTRIAIQSNCDGVGV